MQQVLKEKRAKFKSAPVSKSKPLTSDAATQDIQPDQTLTGLEVTAPANQVVALLQHLGLQVHRVRRLDTATTTAIELPPNQCETLIEYRAAPHVTIPIRSTS